MGRVLLLLPFLLGAFFTLSLTEKSVDSLQSYYPDVTNCFKGVARNESVAIEKNKMHYQSCKGGNLTVDESSLAWKSCMLAFKGLLARGAESRDDIILSVIPDDTARYVGDLLGIDWQAKEVQTNSRVQKDSETIEEKLLKCYDLRFKIEIINLERIYYPDGKLLPLIECIEDAVKC